MFTLTLVALQLASSQLSPRVIRNFVRSGVTKVAFGIMLAIFVGYVAATVRLLQVVSVIAAVARQTLASIDEAVPPAGTYRLADQPPGSAPSRPISLPLARRRHRRTGHGVLLGVDRLARLASRHGCVLEMLVQVGEYLPAGSPVVAVHTQGGGPPDRAVLADIASQALSPAVNQPTTAVQVIDRLEEILLYLGRRPDRSPYCADQAGAVRLIEPVRDWDSYLDLAFSEIIRYGCGSPQVVRRLREESAGQGVSPAILRPDSMSLG